MDIQDIPDHTSTPLDLIDQGFYRWPAGPKTFEVCEACNLNNHRCHFCGDDLRHAETVRGPNLHACYVQVTIEEVIEAASEVFKPEGVTIWVDASNPRLNNATPRQFVNAGDGQRVIDLLTGYAEGSFA